MTKCLKKIKLAFWSHGSPKIPEILESHEPKKLSAKLKFCELEYFGQIAKFKCC